MMQPIAAGYDLNNKQYPRVHNWMEQVKKDTQPYFDDAHAMAMRLRKKTLLDENKSNN
jgi:hypothetical protein